MRVGYILPIAPTCSSSRFRFRQNLSRKTFRLAWLWVSQGPATHYIRSPAGKMVVPQAQSLIPLMSRRLITLNQIANPLCIAFAMSVTGNGIGAAGRFNTNRRPNHSRRNRYRSNLADGDTFIRAPERTSLHPAHSQRTDHNARRKDKVPFGETAGSKSFRLSRRISH